jgi:hypothetical protein
MFNTLILNLVAVMMSDIAAELVAHKLGGGPMMSDNAIFRLTSVPGSGYLMPHTKHTTLYARIYASKTLVLRLNTARGRNTTNLSFDVGSNQQYY